MKVRNILFLALAMVMMITMILKKWWNTWMIGEMNANRRFAMDMTQVTSNAGY